MGTTDLGGGYGFTGCKVTAHSYKFVITYGSSYRSVNRGTFTSKHLMGGFNDGGTKSSYSGTRRKRAAA